MEKLKVDKYQFVMDASFIEKVLNAKLRVMASNYVVKTGDFIEFVEKNEFDFTGRKFYAKVSHVLNIGDNLSVVFQFDLFGYMDIDGERVSIAGEYPNEPKHFPTEPWELADFDFDGTRPAWLYEGIRWHSEISIARLGYEAKAKERPSDLVLRVQGRGGERFFFFESPKEVTDRFTGPQAQSPA